MSMRGALQASKRLFEKIKTEEQEQTDPEIKEECIETEVFQETIDSNQIPLCEDFTEDLSELDSERKNCPYCPAIFESGVGLSNHVRGHLHRVGLSYNARHVVPPEQVVTHDRRPRIRRKMSAYQRLKKALQQQESESETVKSIHSCPLCGDSFDNRTGQSNHIRGHLKKLGKSFATKNKSPLCLLRELMRDKKEFQRALQIVGKKRNHFQYGASPKLSSFDRFTPPPIGCPGVCTDSTPLMSPFSLAGIESEQGQPETKLDVKNSLSGTTALIGILKKRKCQEDGKIKGSLQMARNMLLSSNSEHCPGSRVASSLPNSICEKGEFNRKMCVHCNATFHSGVSLSNHLRAYAKRKRNAVLDGTAFDCKARRYRSRPGSKKKLLPLPQTPEEMYRLTCRKQLQCTEESPLAVNVYLLFVGELASLLTHSNSFTFPQNNHMMNRQSKAPPNLSAKGAKAAAPASKQQQQQQQPQQPGRIPQEFKEAMLHIPVKPAVNSEPTFATAANAKPAKKRPGDENDSMDESNEGSRRAEIYDPYDPVSSDSEHEMLQAQNRNQSPPDQDNQLEDQHLSPGQDCQKKRRFASTFIESVGIDMQDSSPETGPSEGRDLSPDHRPPDHRLPDHRLPDHRLPERQAYSPSTESHDISGYDSMRRHLDHRVDSPDRLIHDSSTQHFPPSYGEQRTNGEERITVPEYIREMTKVRLSPPGYRGTIHFRWNPGEQVLLDWTTFHLHLIIPCDISCDLCDVEFINGLELEDHLESKSHWDMLEYIQQHNNYDDVTISFIQEVMLHKSHQCTRTIESSALQGKSLPNNFERHTISYQSIFYSRQLKSNYNPFFVLSALQENDHMTKIEMFHCAACSDFQVERRLSCLDKAENIMKKLKHQFEHFLEEEPHGVHCSSVQPYEDALGHDWTIQRPTQRLQDSMDSSSVPNPTLTNPLVSLLLLFSFNFFKQPFRRLQSTPH
ncbi:hypothetical protein F7725_011972 [Dissostichus mawsoni]|uniref:C2H2-type domain-containing protein n=1 Tax=Dissostichus mawsoni TaxID=36200 RepID=A0A7J5ZCA4_DISMA|nr:hypothetical protein F7725_011972 [Dissostichus mawsoni]